MASLEPSTKKYTAIWQSGDTLEGIWLKRLFEPYIAENIIDGHHRIVHDNSIVIDTFVHARSPGYYEKFRGKNAFLVHLGDEFYELGTERYLPFRGVFRTIWSNVFNPRHVFVLPLGFSKFGAREGADFLRASERRYAWSFIGQGGKCSRPDALHALQPVEPHFCFSSTSVPKMAFFSRAETGEKRISRADFVGILEQSVFVPTPMGNGSLESPRVYDALESGAIPIIERRLTLDYFQRLLGDHPLPTIRNWSEARELTAKLLNEPENLNALQQRCVNWWADYQSTLIEKIGQFLEERSQSNDALVPLRSKLPTLPGWQYFELMRHHNVPALARRVKRQVGRLATEGRWRVAFRPGAPIPDEPETRPK